MTSQMNRSLSMPHLHPEKMFCSSRQSFDRLRSHSISIEESQAYEPKVSEHSKTALFSRLVNGKSFLHAIPRKKISLVPRKTENIPFMPPVSGSPEFSSRKKLALKINGKPPTLRCASTPCIYDHNKTLPSLSSGLSSRKKTILKNNGKPQMLHCASSPCVDSKNKNLLGQSRIYSETKKSVSLQKGKPHMQRCVSSPCIYDDNETSSSFLPRQGPGRFGSLSIKGEGPRMVDDGNNLIYVNQCNFETPKLKFKPKETERLLQRHSYSAVETNKHPYAQNKRYAENAHNHSSLHEPTFLVGHDGDKLVPGRYTPKLESLIISKLKLIALKKADEGNWEHSYKILQQVLEMQKDTLGKLHPDVTNTMYHIGHALKWMGEYKAALSMLESAYCILSPNIPSVDLVKVIKEIALIQGEIGDLDAAVSLLKRAQSMEILLLKTKTSEAH